MKTSCRLTMKCVLEGDIMKMRIWLPVALVLTLGACGSKPAEKGTDLSKANTTYQNELREKLIDAKPGPVIAIPAGFAARLRQFAWDLPTIKLNDRLSAPMPWTAAHARGAGAVSYTHLDVYKRQLWGRGL